MKMQPVLANFLTEYRLISGNKGLIKLQFRDQHHGPPKYSTVSIQSASQIHSTS
jgi:hypothetical protein